MRHFLDFERPIAELEGKIEELRHLSDRRRAQHRRRGRPARGAGDPAVAPDLCAATPWQKVQVARHPSGRTASDYVARADQPSSCRSPATAPLPRTAAIIGGIGRFRGRSVMVSRHREGRRYREPGHTQFRHGAARGLSEGAPPDAARRALPAAGADLRRYRRGLSRRRRRGARPERGDRPGDRNRPRSPGADNRHDHRRRRLGRRHRAGRRQRRADARARDLYRDLARGLRLDPVARCRHMPRTPPKPCG